MYSYKEQRVFLSMFECNAVLPSKPKKWADPVMLSLKKGTSLCLFPVWLTLYNFTMLHQYILLANPQKKITAYHFLSER